MAGVKFQSWGLKIYGCPLDKRISIFGCPATFFGCPRQAAHEYTRYLKPNQITCQMIHAHRRWGHWYWYPLNKVLMKMILFFQVEENIVTPICYKMSRKVMVMNKVNNFTSVNFGLCPSGYSSVQSKMLRFSTMLWYNWHTVINL